MPILEIELQEALMLEVSDEFLEANGLTFGAQNSMSYCTICSCNLAACG
jgi:hypothetical protein